MENPIERKDNASIIERDEFKTTLKVGVMSPAVSICLGWMNTRQCFNYSSSWHGHGSLCLTLSPMIEFHISVGPGRVRLDVCTSSSRVVIWEKMSSGKTAWWIGKVYSMHRFIESYSLQQIDISI
ncbi:hypothetical protein SAY87_002192 [Trapa incisa]|uniref:Uncharacterized protein n=1 Tax=Trapa incisa TaxID=236973 RepID=A0AAN7JZB8_9MYRT|nr:hypothetical protein SAY87_002192 [Trapa incisa]